MTAVPSAYIDVQLRFATAMALRGPSDLAETALRCTNLHRRFFGFGPPDAHPHPQWLMYTDGLVALPTIQDQVAYSVDFLGRLGRLDRPRPKRSTQAGQAANAGPHFGAFSVAMLDGAIRTHFSPPPSDAISPLHRSQCESRRTELRAAMAYARREFPDAKRVRGASWLYTTTSYRSLFPEAHIATAVARTGVTRFQGSSSWGQFLDYRGQVKSGLRDKFVAGLSSLDPQQPWRAFPIATLTVDSPVEIFDQWLARG